MLNLLQISPLSSLNNPNPLPIHNSKLKVGLQDFLDHRLLKMQPLVVLDIEGVE